MRRALTIGSGALALFALVNLFRALPALVLPVSAYLAFELARKGTRRCGQSLTALLWSSVGLSALLVLGGKVSPMLLPNLAMILIGLGAFFSIAVVLAGDSLRQALLMFAFFAVYLPAGLACVYVPVRSVSLLLETHLPAWAAGIVAEAPEGQLPLVDWSDRLAAIVALGLVGFFYLRERRWLDLQRRQLENLATSKPSSVALGLVELVGQASSAESPLRDGVLMTESDPRPFHVEDDRGRVLVDPRRGKDDSVSLARFLGLELSELSLSGGELRAGDTVYVVGTASVGEGGSAEIIIHPRRERQSRKHATPSFVGEVAKWFAGPKKSSSDYLDAFFVSDRGESRAASSLESRKRRVMVIGLTIVTLASTMALTRHFRLRPPELVFREPVFSQPGFPGALVETLIFLRHPHPDYRIAGARRLKETRPGALDEDTARELLRSALPEAREIAARCLVSARFGPSHRPFFEPAAAAFDENWPATQALVLRSLGPIGFGPTEALPLIARGVESPLHDVRAAAIDGSAAFEVPELAPVLAPALSWWSEREPGISFQEEKELIQRAEGILVNLGSAAAGPLEDMLSSDDVTAEHVSEVLTRAASAPNGLLLRLGELLENERAPIRRGALRGLAKNPLAATESIRRSYAGLVRRHLHDEGSVDLALEALVKTGAEALDERDVRIVLSGLGDSYYRCLSAARVLESAPVDPEDVVDALVGHYRSSTDRYVRAFALEKLTSYPPMPARVEAILIEGLGSDDSLLQVAASKGAAQLDHGSPELVRAASVAANVIESGSTYVNIELLGHWREWNALLALYRDKSQTAALDELLERAASDPGAIPATLAALEAAPPADTYRILRAVAANGSEARAYVERVREHLRGIAHKQGMGSLYADVLSAIEAPPVRKGAPRLVFDANSGRLDRRIPLPDGYTLTLWIRGAPGENERILHCDLLSLWLEDRGFQIVFTLAPVPEGFHVPVRSQLSRVLWDGSWHRIDVSHDASSRTLEVFVDGESRDRFPSYVYGGLAPHPEGGEDVIIRRTPIELSFVELGASSYAQDLVILEGPIR